MRSLLFIPADDERKLGKGLAGETIARWYVGLFAVA